MGKNKLKKLTYFTPCQYTLNSTVIFPYTVQKPKSLIYSHLKVREGFENENLGGKWMAELVMAGGFFMVFIVEELAKTFQHHKVENMGESEVVNKYVHKNNNFLLNRTICCR